MVGVGTWVLDIQENGDKGVLFYTAQNTVVEEKSMTWGRVLFLFSLGLIGWALGISFNVGVAAFLVIFFMMLGDEYWCREFPKDCKKKGNIHDTQSTIKEW